MSLEEFVFPVPLDSFSQLQDRLGATHVLLVILQFQQALTLVQTVPQVKQLQLLAAC